MKLSTLGAGAALAGLALLSPSCASKGPGAPIFFGQTPMGSVDERPIEPVRIDDGSRTTNFSGRKPEPGLAYSGQDVPDRCGTVCASRWIRRGDHGLHGWGPGFHGSGGDPDTDNGALSVARVRDFGYTCGVVVLAGLIAKSLAGGGSQLAVGCRALVGGTCFFAARPGRGRSSWPVGPRDLGRRGRHTRPRALGWVRY
jgi:hypothetical protein